MSPKPEDKAREVIDLMLEETGWHVYDLKEANILIGSLVKPHRILSVMPEVLNRASMYLVIWIPANDMRE